MKVTSVVLTAVLSAPGVVVQAQTTPSPTYTGCFPQYVADPSRYTVDDLVSATVTDVIPATTESCTGTSNGCENGTRIIPERTVQQSYNFECISNDWCGSQGRGPGEQYESTAWRKMEKCQGTAAVTTYVPDPWAGGGCPSPYVDGGAETTYEVGNVVSVDKGSYFMVYSCTASWCGQSGYAPGSTQHWSNTWEELGSCSGSLSPTSSPSFDVLEDKGPCPDEWVAPTDNNDKYEPGDTISANGLVFECKPWPQSGHCSQAGYVPMNADAATADAWKDAWIVSGYCDGTSGPTASPSFDVLENAGPCPDAWEARTGTDDSKYEEGDRISANGLVFECRMWPWSGHCGQDGYQPLNADAATADAWKDAWILKGYCEGTIGPTASPSFDVLEEFGDGCPAAYSTSAAADYEYGDLVSIEVSDTPDRKVVYECKQWPDGDHCVNTAENMRPGAEYGNLGWTLKGYCDGTIAPTDAPTQYSGTCTFIKCEVDDCDGGEAAVNAVAGSTACSCGVDPPPASFCTQKTCVVTNVNTWNNSVQYDNGDIVRVGADKYRCKEAGWCRQAAYEPEVGLYWRQAWAEDGTCPP